MRVKKYVDSSNEPPWPTEKDARHTEDYSNYSLLWLQMDYHGRLARCLGGKTTEELSWQANGCAQW